MDLGNSVAIEGVTRCYCGAKYWEQDVCVSCGESVNKSLHAENIVDRVPDGYRWATADETENWTYYEDRVVQVMVGWEMQYPLTDLAIKE